MSNTDTGGPAFPTENYRDVVPVATGYAEGMTLRDYFAAKAMSGVFPLCETNKSAAEKCYEVADAMLKARQA